MDRGAGKGISTTPGRPRQPFRLDRRLAGFEMVKFLGVDISWPVTPNAEIQMVLRIVINRKRGGAKDAEGRGEKAEL